VDFPISVPSIGLVDGKFVDEDPVGGTPGSLIPAVWGNSVTLEILNVIEAAGLIPSEVDLTQLLQSIRQIAATAIGARNAHMSVSAASAVSTFTADEIVVKTALGGSAWLLPNFNKTINLGTVGPGGMDVGTAPSNGYIAIYAIYSPATGASALLATNATSSVAAEVYTGAHMPAGYTASALVSIVRTTAAGLMSIFTLFNREVVVAASVLLTTSTPHAAFTPLISTTFIPMNAKSISGTININSPSASTSTAQLSPDGVIDIKQATLGGGASAQIVVGFDNLKITVPQQIQYTNTASSGTPSYTFSLMKYSF
jgi:hypothetical protein